MLLDDKDHGFLRYPQCTAKSLAHSSCSINQFQSPSLQPLNQEAQVGGEREQWRLQTTGEPMSCLEHHSRWWLLCRKAALESVHFLPSSCREVVTWPMTKERMNKWVFTYLGNNTGFRKTRAQEEGADEVCTVTSDERGQMCCGHHLRAVCNAEPQGPPQTSSSDAAFEPDPWGWVCTL